MAARPSVSPMSSHPADWYPDPMGRFDVRYWNGSEWTEHVSTQGQTAVDPLDQPQQGAVGRGMDSVDRYLTVGDEGNREKIARQLQGQGWRGAGIESAVGGGGGSVLDEPILVVNQKAKVLELNQQFSVFDQNGNQIAFVNQVGQSAARRCSAWSPVSTSSSPTSSRSPTWAATSCSGSPGRARCSRAASWCRTGRIVSSAASCRRT